MCCPHVRSPVCEEVSTPYGVLRTHPRITRAKKNKRNRKRSFCPSLGVPQQIFGHGLPRTAIVLDPLNFALFHPSLHYLLLLLLLLTHLSLFLVALVHPPPSCLSPPPLLSANAQSGNESCAAGPAGRRTQLSFSYLFGAFLVSFFLSWFVRLVALLPKDQEREGFGITALARFSSRRSRRFVSISALISLYYPSFFRPSP
jgi:hypothetical protein